MGNKIDVSSLELPNKSFRINPIKPYLILIKRQSCHHIEPVNWFALKINWLGSILWQLWRLMSCDSSSIRFCLGRSGLLFSCFLYINWCNFKQSGDRYVSYALLDNFTEAYFFKFKASWLAHKELSVCPTSGPSSMLTLNELIFPHNALLVELECMVFLPTWFFSSHTNSFSSESEWAFDREILYFVFSNCLALFIKENNFFSEIACQAICMKKLPTFLSFLLWFFRSTFWPGLILLDTWWRHYNHIVVLLADDEWIHQQFDGFFVDLAVERTASNTSLLKCSSLSFSSTSTKSNLMSIGKMGFRLYRRKKWWIFCWRVFANPMRK